ncbi:rho GTPase-activating protein 39-like isoform X2 [Corticium candelabrum]|uniref:rho GTPase-activating protein 39-like isoform X2 n=1 Tax=Corticium candelabrum TaxID=121492 RepID=UPI002E27555F|nr:rho GTPase-activating protein 39-like isoform X2 [Corticium candelabrum]
MADGDWVEIIEPSSGERMYANLETGECVWEAPDGTSVRKTHDRQWWELYDERTAKFYYYNAHTQKTVWRKPLDGEIIALSMLQKAIREQQLENEASQEVNASPSNHVNNQDLTQSYDVSMTSAAESGDRDASPLSPHAVDDSHTPDSGMATDNSTDEKCDEHNSQDSPPPGEHNGSDMDIETQEELDLEDKETAIATKEVREEAQQSLDDQAQSPSENTDEPPIVEPDYAEPPPTPPATPPPSPDSHDGQIVGVMPPVPAPPPLPKAKPRSSVKKKANCNFQRLVNTLERSTTTLERSQGPVKPLRRSGSVGSSTPSPTAVSPKAISSAVAMPGLAAPRMESFDDLEQHRRGIFRRKVSLANMLSWTKESIGKPMIMQRDKKLKKEAVDLFKLVQIYMGDRKARKDPSKVALDIVCRCWTSTALRDELYIQLARQTTGNSNSQSLLRGWELFSICLGFFPPSGKFQSYLEGYVYRHLEPETANVKGVPISVHAAHCYKRLERMRDTGAKRGIKKPTLEEIEQARIAPYHPSMFGNTLEDVMELQQERFADRALPWIMTTLCAKMLELRAHETEGVFRVPGDIDEVNSLKLLVDKFEMSNQVRDPHVPGSLLKLWFRDLCDPLIPQHYYDECLYNYSNVANALSVADSLPSLNRQVLMYIVRFLQGFSRGEIVEHTKMDVSNLAMVWAPNFLRCPSTDPLEIFENTRREMTFLRTLIEHWDTADADGMV